MAVTYQSIASASQIDAALVITKPSGLAVGDTMVAGIFFNNDDTGSGSIATPAGWTQVSTDGNTAFSLKVFTKLADSADVAASNFTFTQTGDTTYHLIGHIVRISEFGLIAGETSEFSTTSGTATVIAPTFTPTRANTLFLAFAAQSLSGGATPNNVSVALTTDNPTWTERAEANANDGTYDSALAAYTATRAETTATGNITATFAGTAAGNLKALSVISISSQINGDITPTTYVNAYAYSPINATSYAEAYVTDPTDNIRNNTTTPWVNEEITTTEWINE